MIDELLPFGEPKDDQVQEFVDLVRARDGDGLYKLISQKYPTVLWGGVMKRGLSGEEQRWASSAIESAAHR